MEDFDDDPLDLLEDDGDGVIEKILLSEEEDEKNIQTRTGCSILLLGLCSAAVGTGWGIVRLIS